MVLKIQKIYTQRDPAYKDVLLGFNTDKKYTIGTVGCLLTLIATYLTSTGRACDPKELNELIKGVKGFVKGTGLYIWESLGWLYPEYSIYTASDRYETTPFPDKGFQTIRDLAKQGYFVMLEIDFDPTLGGEQMHFVGVIETRDNGTIVVADPWTGSPRELSSFGDIATITIAYKAYNKKVATDAVVTPTPTTEPETNYPQIKVLLWRALRVFVSGSLGVLTLDLISKMMNAQSVGDIKYVVALVVAGGIAALGKWLRDTFGNEDQTSLIDKLPF
jgi:hypothetical protein